MTAGLFLVLFGSLLAASNLNLVDPDRYLRFWPAFVIAAGALKAIEPGQGLAGAIVMVAGAALLVWSLGLLRFNIFDLWPLLLIGIGLLMLARGTGFVGEPHMPGNFALFSSPNVTETSSDYRGARISAVMSGYKLDLTGAEITQNPAVLNVFAMWSGIEVLVPDGWEVVTEVMPLMAGVDVKTSRSVAVAPRSQLVIRGFVMWAGIEVRSAAKRIV